MAFLILFSAKDTVSCYWDCQKSGRAKLLPQRKVWERQDRENHPKCSRKIIAFCFFVVAILLFSEPVRHCHDAASHVTYIIILLHNCIFVHTISQKWSQLSCPRYMQILVSGGDFRKKSGGILTLVCNKLPLCATSSLCEDNKPEKIICKGAEPEGTESGDKISL